MSATGFLSRISLVLTCALAACGKKEQPIEPFVSATAGSFKFYSSGQMVTNAKTTVGPTTSMLIQAVMPGSGATLTLWIKNYSGALDTISIDSLHAAATWLPPTPSIETRSVSGTLIITESTPAYKGIFNFICSDTTRVQGEFKVPPR